MFIAAKIKDSQSLHALAKKPRLRLTTLTELRDQGIGLFPAMVVQEGLIEMLSELTSSS